MNAPTPFTEPSFIAVLRTILNNPAHQYWNDVFHIMMHSGHDAYRDIALPIALTIFADESHINWPNVVSLLLIQEEYSGRVMSRLKEILSGGTHPYWSFAAETLLRNYDEREKTLTIIKEIAQETNNPNALAAADMLNEQYDPDAKKIATTVYRTIAQTKGHKNRFEAAERLDSQWGQEDTKENKEIAFAVYKDIASTAGPDQFKAAEKLQESQRYSYYQTPEEKSAGSENLKLAYDAYVQIMQTTGHTDRYAATKRLAEKYGYRWDETEEEKKIGKEMLPQIYAAYKEIANVPGNDQYFAAREMMRRDFSQYFDADAEHKTLIESGIVRWSEDCHNQMEAKETIARKSYDADQLFVHEILCTIMKDTANEHKFLAAIDVLHFDRCLETNKDFACDLLVTVDSEQDYWLNAMELVLFTGNPENSSLAQAFLSSILESEGHTFESAEIILKSFEETKNTL